MDLSKRCCCKQYIGPIYNKPSGPVGRGLIRLACEWCPRHGNNVHHVSDLGPFCDKHKIESAAVSASEDATWD